MELYDHTSDIEIVVVIVEGVLSRDSWAAQRIEVTDHVRDRGFHCPSVGQSTQTCLGCVFRRLTLPKLLNRAQAYEESENVGRNPTSNPTMGDVIAARYDRRDILKGTLGI